MNTDAEQTESQVVSKERVTEHGEVFTNKREVNAMLDLVKHETERIDSRFLEPACGTGNFLSEILERKIAIVRKRYKRNQLEFEKYMVLALSSIYGIDKLEDNVIACRKRLYELVDSTYIELFGKAIKSDFLKTINYILRKNIIWGDALSFRREDNVNEFIVFSEWSFPFNNSKIMQKDFVFQDLLIENNEGDDFSLFANREIRSDLGLKVPPAPKEIKNHPLKHFLKLGDSDE
jgi:hypothetical protein